MDSKFLKLHTLSVKICIYCNHLKTIDNFKSNHNKSKYTVRCIDCRNKAEDFRKTDYMDSSGLGMLIKLRKYFGSNADIRLRTANPQVMNILEID